MELLNIGITRWKNDFGYLDAFTLLMHIIVAAHCELPL